MRVLSSTVPLFFSMLGDPAVLGDTDYALTTADLLNNVAVKLPPFWPDNIETWLVQYESQFRLQPDEV